MENKPYGVVYRITNLVNGKMYIGQTTKKNPTERFNAHVYDSKKSKRPISLAIKEFGKQSFVFQVCKVCYSKEELNEHEGLLIEKYKTYKEENGYNLDRYIDGKVVRNIETINKITKFLRSEKMREVSRRLGHACRGIKRSENSSSKYIGVRGKEGRWEASYSINSKRIHIGRFKEESVAAMAYDINILENFGEDQILNFPELKDHYIARNIVIERGELSNKEDIMFRGFKTQN